MATLRKRTDTERGHKYEHTELVPMEWKNGQATRYEVLHNEEEDRPPAVWDDAPIVAPTPADRLPRVQRVIEGSPVDEARAFNIRVSSLAAVLGGGVVLAALIFGASLSFWSALMYFGTVFALTWAGAFALDAFTSAGGIELFHAMRMWRFLDREQAHRHQRYATPKTDRQRALETILFAAAVGTTALAVLGLLVAVFMENVPR